MSSILTVGDKLDIRILQQVESQEKTGEYVKAFKSIIYDIQRDGELELGMPMEAGKMVLLSLGLRYELVFYTKNGLYRCIGQVKERYKSDNLYMVTMELKSSLSKFQRRDYYRFECLLDLQFLPIEQDEVQQADDRAILARHTEVFRQGVMKTGTAVDISGGGLRFVSEEKLSQDIGLFVKLVLSNEIVNQTLWIPAIILQGRRLEGELTRYEYRIEFVLKESRVREQIIKYIFEEERKNRKNEKG